MFAVEIYAAVRRFVFIEGNSRREAARVFGLSRDTIAKMCRYSAPPGYVRTKAPKRPKLGPLLPVIDAILETGKTHVCLALGLAACQRGLSVAFTTAAGLVHQLMEARDEKRLLRLQAQLAAVKLLIVDELGYVPLSQTGAELLFEVFSQRHERGSTIVTSNLPFDEWTGVFGNQRLTGALLDRLTHHVHILEMNGESYRLKQSRARRRKQPQPTAEQTIDPDTGEISPT